MTSTKEPALPPIRLALIGCGGISGAHIDGFKELVKGGCKDIVYSACYSRREQDARRKAREIAEIQGFEPRVFTEINALIAAGIADGADLCLPHYMHHQLGIQVLDGGLHAMIEKPLGLTIKASRLIIDAARRNNRILATAENIRRGLSARACAWAIKERKLIGDIREVHVADLGFGKFDYDNPILKWRGLKLLTGGGMIMDSGAHFADMQMVLFGEPDEISCHMSTNDTRTISDAPIFGDVMPTVEDAWHAVIRFRNGTSVIWSYSRSFPGATLRHARYFGSKGSMEDLGNGFHSFEGGANTILADQSIVSNGEVEREYLATLGDEEKKRLFPFGCTHSFGIEIWDFADSIRNRRKPELDGEDGLRAKALCEACFESATLGRPVKYADVLSGKISEYQNPINKYWKI
ncbi:MAG: oxidoreductase domain protein [Rariglobus sp.]|jgi:predicted dehydrogenase|nr:oxidoreductase domain protein [Rariglobus sp.]